MQKLLLQIKLSAERKKKQAYDRMKADSMRKTRNRYLSNGLTTAGKPRRNKNRNGLSKDHAAYVRVWRAENGH